LDTKPQNSLNGSLPREPFIFLSRGTAQGLGSGRPRLLALGRPGVGLVKKENLKTDGGGALVF
jgi:hypothetical protein